VFECANLKTRRDGDMERRSKREIYFSFFMFTADLRPDDEQYTKILIGHLNELVGMGYDGFDVHIASQPPSVKHEDEVNSYRRLRRAFDQAGLKGVKFTTNVGTTRYFDPTSPFKEQRQAALAYLKSRVDITYELGGESIMAGPFVYPYGVYPVTDNNEQIWSDDLLDWLQPRYLAAQPVLEELGAYAAPKGVKLAIEPVKNWETPGPNMVSDVLEILRGVKTSQCGVAIDSAQVVMESQGPAVFRHNVKVAAEQGRLHYVHISAPDRGNVEDSWVPWDIILGEIDPVYKGPYLIEIFNAVPPFAPSMRMSRRRFWRPQEDPEGKGECAYKVAKDSLSAMREALARRSGI
jgi:sugar phosphate isomerase/epimerase